MSENAEWLGALKAGDEAAISRGYGYRSHTIVAVDRVTRTQVVVGGARYRRDNGHRMGHTGWESIRLVPVTDEVREEIARRAFAERVSRFPWAKLSMDQIRQIQAVLDSDQGKGMTSCF